MKIYHSKPDVVEQVLMRMPPDIAVTFSPAQYQALQAALTPRRHPVNIRLSIPTGGARIYLVVLAGKETRSIARRRVEAAEQALWTPLNLLVMVGTTVVSILALLALVYLSHLNLGTGLKPQVAPAAVPFKADQASCEQSGRVWQGETCLDFEHDSTF
ncbi:hypothetical protein C8255_26970 [filamentous cyanobacterium CCP3]|nr:hypothetical protein C8255_26970 [filamentous cyanobacterium CCP3]